MENTNETQFPINEAHGAEGVDNKKDSIDLAELGNNDRNLREKLDGTFSDDGQYFDLLAQINMYSKKAESTMIQGYERARLNAVVAKLREKLEQTMRAIAEGEFVTLEKEKDMGKKSSGDATETRQAS